MTKPSVPPLDRRRCGLSGEINAHYQPCGTGVGVDAWLRGERVCPEHRARPSRSAAQHQQQPRVAPVLPVIADLASRTQDRQVSELTAERDRWREELSTANRWVAAAGERAPVDAWEAHEMDEAAQRADEAQTAPRRAEEELADAVDADPPVDRVAPAQAARDAARVVAEQAQAVWRETPEGPEKEAARVECNRAFEASGMAQNGLFAACAPVGELRKEAERARRTAEEASTGEHGVPSHVLTAGHRQAVLDGARSELVLAREVVDGVYGEYGTAYKLDDALWEYSIAREEGAGGTEEKAAVVDAALADHAAQGKLQAAVDKLADAEAANDRAQAKLVSYRACAEQCVETVRMYEDALKLRG